MAIRLTNTDTIQTYINMIVYGDSGVGKTTLTGTAPSPLIISAEGGLMPLKGKGIDVFEIKTRADCNEVFEWLKLSAEAKAKYKTVCLDSMSEIAEVLLADELALTKDARQAYGVMANEMSILIRSFRDLPYNTVFVAKTKKIVAEASGRITYMPSVPGQSLLQNLPYFFDEVMFMNFGTTAEGVKFRYLQTVGDAQYVAKDRSGALLPMEKPDLKYLFNKIQLKLNPKEKAKETKETKKPTQTQSNTKGK